MESHNEMMTFESHAITITKTEEPLWIPAIAKMLEFLLSSDECNMLSLLHEILMGRQLHQDVKVFQRFRN